VYGIKSTVDIPNLVRKGDTLLVSQSRAPKDGNVCVYEKAGETIIEMFNRKTPKECGIVVKVIQNLVDSW
jgi:SOS-response transcriptional repressor LexA